MVQHHAPHTMAGNGHPAAPVYAKRGLVKCSAVGQSGTAPASALSAGPAASPFSAGAPAPAGAATAAGSELRDGSRAPASASHSACEASLLRHGLLLCTGQRLLYGGLHTASEGPQAAAWPHQEFMRARCKARLDAACGSTAHMPCLHSALSACWPPRMAATQSGAVCMHAYPNMTLPYPLLWMRAQLTRPKTARPTRAGKKRRGGLLFGGRGRQRVRGGHRASGGRRQRRLRHLLQPREDERHHLRQHRARRLR